MVDAVVESAFDGQTFHIEGAAVQCDPDVPGRIYGTVVAYGDTGHPQGRTSTGLYGGGVLL